MRATLKYKILFLLTFFASLNFQVIKSDGWREKFKDKKVWIGVGVAALFINYCTEANKSIDNAKASYLLSLSLGLFTAGRFVGTALMRKIVPNVLLTSYSIINVLLCIAVVTLKGWLSVYSLMAVFFFESIMFPTIFALGVKDLGHHTKKGSSFIIMSIVGGALVPYVMGMLSERSTAQAYIVPLICFIVVAWYGWKGYKTK